MVSPYPPLTLMLLLDDYLPKWVSRTIVAIIDVVLWAWPPLSAFFTWVKTLYYGEVAEMVMPSYEAALDLPQSTALMVFSGDSHAFMSSSPLTSILIGLGVAALLAVFHNCVPRVSTRRELHQVLASYDVISTLALLYSLINHLCQKSSYEASLFTIPNSELAYVLMVDVMAQLLMLEFMLISTCTWTYCSHEYMDGVMGVAFNLSLFITSPNAMAVAEVCVIRILSCVSSKLHLISFSYQMVTPALCDRFYPLLTAIEMTEVAFCFFVMGIQTEWMQVVALCFLIIPNALRVVRQSAPTQNQPHRLFVCNHI